MAVGLNIEQIPNRVNEISDGALVYSGEVGVSGYEDAVTTKAEWLKEDRDRITANEDNIETIQTQISDISNQFSFVRRTGDVSSFQITQSENSYLFMIGLLKTSTTTNPTVSVGTESGLDDIVSSREITGSERIVITGNYELTNDTLFFTVNGGEVSTTIIYMKEFFNV
jgi:hypothetical protein